MAGIGSLECPKVHDWVIKESDLKKMGRIWVLYSPVFVVKNCLFRLLLSGATTEVVLLLQKLSKEPVTIDLLSIYLVGANGSMQEIGTKGGLSFAADQDAGILVAQFAKPAIFHDGVLRIRFILEVKSDDVSPLPTSLAEDLCRAHQTRIQFCDFTLVCGEREIPVQRNLLAARSPVFQKMFEHNDTEEAKTGRAVVKDVNPEALQALVKFAETDVVDDEDITVDLLAASNKYDVRALFSKCEAKLIGSLTVDNAADCFLAAYLHEANTLRKCAKEFIAINFDAVEKTEGMMSYCKQYPNPLWDSA